MLAATVCVFRTLKIEGCASSGRRPLRWSRLFAVYRCPGFVFPLRSRSLFCWEVPPSLPALRSRLPASQLLSPLLCQRGRTDKATKQGVPIIIILHWQFDLQSRGTNKETKKISYHSGESLHLIPTNKNEGKKTTTSVLLIQNSKRSSLSQPIRRSSSVFCFRVGFFLQFSCNTGFRNC